MKKNYRPKRNEVKNINLHVFEKNPTCPPCWSFDYRHVSGHFVLWSVLELLSSLVVSDGFKF